MILEKGTESLPVRGNDERDEKEGHSDAPVSDYGADIGNTVSDDQEQEGGEIDGEQDQRGSSFLSVREEHCGKDQHE